MANKQLKSIKFPGLSDTYKIPQTADDLTYGSGTVEDELDSLETNKATTTALAAHTGNTSNPHSVTAEQTAYNSSASSHTSGSVAAQLSSHSSQIEDLEEKTATFYRDSQGYLCEY